MAISAGNRSGWPGLIQVGPQILRAALQCSRVPLTPRIRGLTRPSAQGPGTGRASSRVWRAEPTCRTARMLFSGPASAAGPGQRLELAEVELPGGAVGRLEAGQGQRHFHRLAAATGGLSGGA